MNKKMWTMLLALLLVVACASVFWNADNVNDYEKAANYIQATATTNPEIVRVDEETTSETTLPEEEETIQQIKNVPDTSRHYYNQLSEPEKELYNLIGEKRDDFVHNIPVRLISTDDGWVTGGREMAERALTAYRLDNPITSIWLADTKIEFWWESDKNAEESDGLKCEGFYVAPAGYAYTYGLFDYVEDSAAVSQMIEEVEIATKEFVQTLAGNDKEKYAAINQWLIDGCKYTTETSQGGNVYGSIICRASRCSGDAMAFKYVCDMANLPCIIVEGLLDENVEEAKEKREELELELRNHAWNMTFTADEGWSMTDITNNREFLAAEQEEEEIVVAGDTWLLLDPESDQFKSTHLLYDGHGFEYPN